MDRVFESGAVGSPPSAPASPSSGYTTAGNPATATPATKPGPYWFHQVTEELRAVITAAGLTPSHTNLTQVRDAIKSLISGKAPLDSPVFSGNPSAPTPPALDNDLSIATTEFVKKSGLTFASAAYVTALPSTLTASHAGHFVNVSVQASGQLFLPVASSVQNGAAITVFNASSYSIHITRYSAPDIIVIGNSGSATTYDMEPGTFAVFTCDNGGWVMGARTSQLGKTALFGSLLSGNGYQKLPSGLIFQWGAVEFSYSTSPIWTYPIAFPSACQLVIPIILSNGINSFTAYAKDINGTVSTQIYKSTPGTSANMVSCLAIGY